MLILLRPSPPLEHFVFQKPSCNNVAIILHHRDHDDLGHELEHICTCIKFSGKTSSLILQGQIRNASRQHRVRKIEIYEN